ncbi:MAG TPA: hypothetical protein VG223_05810 [Solirubrobacteraceae bacterium]|jgi:hypothetical protein|nr:hypothetical protein [Solirubrobacteraceae bacterium]
MADKPQKINIGFLGGPSLVARVTPEELTKLRNALPAGGWHDLRAEDGTVALDLGKVVYVMADTEVHRVGFGT